MIQILISYFTNEILISEVFVVLEPEEDCINRTKYTDGKLFRHTREEQICLGKHITITTLGNQKTLILLISILVRALKLFFLSMTRVNHDMNYQCCCAKLQFASNVPGYYLILYM
jgi:hypothetical protein